MSRHTKVDQTNVTLQLLGLEQDVFRLDVAMDDVRLMHVTNSLYHL
jgi:hypothetical protein